MEWEPCSECGAVQRRRRGLCCPGNESFDQCAANCNRTFDQAFDSRSCVVCNNGGFYNTTISGCVCAKGYDGVCCNIGKLKILSVFIFTYTFVEERIKQTLLLEQAYQSMSKPQS